MVHPLSKDEIVERVSSDMSKTQECEIKIRAPNPENYSHGLWVSLGRIHQSIYLADTWLIEALVGHGTHGSNYHITTPVRGNQNPAK